MADTSMADTATAGTNPQIGTPLNVKRADCCTQTAIGAILEKSGAPLPYSESRPITISEVTLTPPGPGELLVEVKAAGVCHSDLSVVNNNRPRPLPMLLGHEAAGVVKEVGEGVTQVAPGDHVVMTFLPRCGECPGCKSHGMRPCEPGSAANAAGTLLSGSSHITRHQHSPAGEHVYHHLGVSGFATHAVVAEASVVKVGVDVPFDIAAILGCAILTGGGAILNELQPTPDSRVAVVGLGGVGMSAIITAAALGVREIVGIDLSEEKREQALTLGATKVMSPDEAVAAAAEGFRFDGVVEAAGHPKALETAYKVTAPGGLTVTVGLPAPESTITIDPLVLTAEARRLHGSYLGSSVPSVDIPRYEQLWREGLLKAEGLISHRIELSELNEAMDRLSSGEALRQIIMF